MDGHAIFCYTARVMRITKNTKIVCTIGPAANTPEAISAMIEAGMDVCRLNFSHGTYDQHAAMIVTIRAAAAKAGRHVALLQDLQGPKIRVGDLPQEGVQLVAGAETTFTTEHGAALPKITVTWEHLHEDLKAGDHVLLDDGLLDVEVLRVEGRDIVTRVITGGTLTSHKGFNLPTASLTVPAITDKDKEDLKFGVAQGVDFIALSFVRDAKDIKELRALIDAAGDRKDVPIMIVSKIEKHEAIRNIDAIIAESDGIMVARGDLGIETPAEDVPIHQKRIIDKCRKAGKPVIVATQMLDSMIRNPRPTRAEVSDVANAVIDHTDAVMLSGESASGKYPLEAVATMARIVHETEASEFDDVDPHQHAAVTTAEDAASEAAAVLASDAGAKAIIVSTVSGRAARVISRERPALSIHAVAADDRVVRQLALSWGVSALPLAAGGSATDMLKGLKVVQAGDTVITVGDDGAVSVRTLE